MSEYKRVINRRKLGWLCLVMHSLGNSLPVFRQDSRTQADVNWFLIHHYKRWVTGFICTSLRDGRKNLKEKEGERAVAWEWGLIGEFYSTVLYLGCRRFDGTLRRCKRRWWRLQKTCLDRGWKWKIYSGHWKLNCPCRSPWFPKSIV